MFGNCCWDRNSELYPQIQPLLQPFSLPSPIPQWPSGQGFATGRINLGEIEVTSITEFESIGSCSPLLLKSDGVTFYKPVEIPDGFFILGHYCQSNDQPLRGYVLVAQDIAATNLENNCIYDAEPDFSALKKPINYTLIWSSNSRLNQSVYIWLPNAPAGYIALGFIVTNEPDEPELEEVRCVRADLTDTCESCDLILSFDSIFLSTYQFRVWNTRPCERGILGRGVSVGTFFCSTGSEDDPNIACLKNVDPTLHAMPNLDQIHALIKHYGPTMFFHPDEAYLPSSVPWFFKNGALLYKDGKDNGIAIDSWGSILPAGGTNDGKFWLDLPDEDDEGNFVKNGNMESAKLYVHVKPALGGTFTDIAMWVFCPFNGPSTIKAGLVNIALNKIGQHVGDWEHFTLRLSNFTGELWSVYFSEHSGGEWVDASDLEFIEGNKAVVYSSKNGHASYPHAGTYIQGSSKLGIGLRNDTDQSKYFVDSSVNYEIIAAEHLGDGVVEEPPWLQYMREWGPTIVYDSRTELDKIISHLPFFFRFSVESLFELFPTELYGEEGPTGPKEKDNWFGDESNNNNNLLLKNNQNQNRGGGGGSLITAYFPRLGDLTLAHCLFGDIAYSLSIYAPLLKNLYLSVDSRVVDSSVDKCKVMISAPNVISMTCLGPVSHDYHIENNISSLVNGYLGLQIHGAGWGNVEGAWNAIKLFDLATNVKTMSLSNGTIQILSSLPQTSVLDKLPIFGNLKDLQLKAYDCKGHLQIRTDDNSPGPDKLLLLLPFEFVCNNLKVVRINNLSNINNTQLEFMKCILDSNNASSSVLARMEIKLQLPKVRDEMLLKEELSKHPRVSSISSLQVQDNIIITILMLQLNFISFTVGMNFNFLAIVRVNVCVYISSSNAE